MLVPTVYVFFIIRFFSLFISSVFFGTVFFAGSAHILLELYIFH